MPKKNFRVQGRMMTGASYIDFETVYEADSTGDAVVQLWREIQAQGLNGEGQMTSLRIDEVAGVGDGPAA